MGLATRNVAWRGPLSDDFDRKDGPAEIVAWTSAVRGMDKPGHIVITTSRDAFARAVRLHQAGDLDGAARLYEWVLNEDGNHMPTPFTFWEFSAIIRGKTLWPHG